MRGEECISSAQVVVEELPEIRLAPSLEELEAMVVSEVVEEEEEHRQMVQILGQEAEVEAVLS